jgi:hypothetical protein
MNLRYVMNCAFSAVVFVSAVNGRIPAVVCAEVNCALKMVEISGQKTDRQSNLCTQCSAVQPERLENASTG